jgi:DNA-binding transcriptional MocR family regulator
MDLKTDALWTLSGDDPASLPLYKRIIALIERGIENGLLYAGQRLPSERRLCALLGVNRSTVIHALSDLEDRGLLLRRQGSGTFVNGKKWGVQHYPVLNWLPRAPGGAQRIFSAGRRRERTPEPGLLDLSGSDLAVDLKPCMRMPEGSWQEVLRQELDEESSLTGLPSFKEAICEHLRRFAGLEAERDQVLVTSGAQQSLFLITQCLLRPGDAVGLETPSYFYSLPVFQAAGLRLFAIPTDGEGICPEGLDDVVSRRRIRMVFLNPVFQNPTGHVMSAGRKRDILRYCSARRIPIVEDDAYSLLAFPGAGDTRPLKSLDRQGQVLYIGSLSSYMGKNLRAGWLIAPRSVTGKLAEARLQMDAGLSVLPQILAWRYLRTAWPEHGNFLRRELERRAAALQEHLRAALPGTLAFSPARGGFYLYARALEGAGRALAALREHGIVPAAGEDFGDREGSFRLNFAHAGPLAAARG